MKTLLDVLQYSTTLAFSALGLAALANWLRYRDRRGAYLTLGLGSLGVVSVLGRIAALPGFRAPWISTATLVGLQVSGLALLLFRGAFIPLPRWVPWAAALGLGLPVLAATLVGLPAPGVTPTRLQSAIILGIVLSWAICVGEPTLRFWLASRHRPAVQSRRLRAMSLAYFGIIVILLVAGVGGSAATQPVVQVATQGAALLLAPLLYVSFAPPRLLRRIWREREEEHFRAAFNQLLLFAPNRVTLAERALEWAVRLVGAEAGFVADGTGQVLACREISWKDAAARAAVLDQAREGREGNEGKGPIHDDSTIVVPLHLDSGTGYLVTVSGAFTPLFGSDEVQRLEQYATSLVAALDRARVSERMTALEEVKSRFLKLASHELRGPLGLVRGYVSMLADGSMDAEAFTAVSGTLLRKLDQMSGMLRQMLDTARLEDERLDLRPERFDLRGVIDQVVESMTPFAGQTHTIRVTMPREEVAVVADPAKVETIISNLIDNAIKYSPAGGEVACSLSGGETAIVEVTDQGIGIPEDQMPVLFTRFGRVSNPDTIRIAGTGLGLYLSRELARMQQGDITAESEPGRGSTFALSLPVAPV